MRLTLLGTAGWLPTESRETTCFAIEDGPRLLVFDAGTGLRRLAASPWAGLVQRCDEAHLFLSHYHLDHVCGLAYLPAVFAGRRLVVHPPDVSLTGVDPARALADLIRPPYNPRPWHELPDVEMAPVKAGPNDIAGHRLTVRAQTHSDTSVAYRLDDALAVVTDTAADPATAHFAQGVGLLLHEAWYVGGDPGDGTASLPAGYAAHSEARAVARLAAEAGVGRLVFIHLNPLRDEAAHAAMAAAARETFPAAGLSPDGDVLPLGGD